jgi:hypothetical protein
VAACLALAARAIATAAEPLSATVAVSERDVFVGDTFDFQVQVSGSENPEKPDLSGLADFVVQELGGQRNSSQSISIVNGSVTRDVRKGFVFSYRLSPKRAGNLEIPAITVRAEGQSVQTPPLTIAARKPMETDKFKLRLQLPKARCYVGEPITLTLTWYIGQPVRGFAFSLPLLSNGSLFFADPPMDTSGNRKYLRIPLNDGEAIGEEVRERLEGVDFTAIRIQKVLIPKQAGRIDIAPASVVCEAIVGYKKSQSRFPSLFGDDFGDGFFGGGKQPVIKKAVVPSNALTLDVADLPAEGRPPTFAGLVGEYRIAVKASAQDVNVGDPITLTIALSGPAYMEHVSLPPLQQQAALARDFKIPTEMAPGKLEGRVKVFTQTVRALRPDVKEIPPIEMPYFDPRTERYEVARSAPVPLTVKAAKVLTAADAEGREITSPAAQELEAWTRGIAHNYEDLGALRDQRRGPETWVRSAGWLVCLFGPPLAFLILAGTMRVVRRRNADPLAARARGTYRRLLKALDQLPGTEAAAAEAISGAIRQYLGDKLRVRGGALTFADARDPLRSRGASQETVDALRGLLERCEAGRYAGRTENTDRGPLAAEARDLAKRLERELT